MPPPPNDNFSGRLAIPGLDSPVNGYNVSATLGPGESDWTEGFGKTIWWSWTSTVSGEVAVVAPPRKFVAVFTGSTLHGLTQLARGWTQVNFVAQAGTTYQFLLDSVWYDTEPTMRLVVTRPPTLVITAPTNNAEYYSPATVMIAGLAWDPSGQVPEVIAEGFIGGAILYETNANNFSFLLTNVPPGNYSLTLSAINSSGAQTQEERSFRVTPPNNMFSNAIPIVGSPLLVVGSNRNANREDAEPQHGYWYDAASVWWAWTPTNSGPVTIACAFGNGYTPSLGVYTGHTLSTLTRVTNSVRSNTVALAQFTATAGMTYKIAVDSESYEEGDIYLGINFSPVPPLPAIPLAFGVPANNLTGSFDSETLYRIDVPDGLASLRISIAGGTGDCDLYVRYGLRPSLTDYDFAPYLDGNDETVTITTPAPGYWYILLYGFGSYSGVSLLAQ
jgi:hypothetical protein